MYLVDIIWFYYCLDSKKPREKKKKRGRKGVVLKIGGKGSKGKNKKETPGPVEDGEYEVNQEIFCRDVKFKHNFKGGSYCRS